MTIREIVNKGSMRYARRALWLFGFFVGIAGGSSPVTYISAPGAGGDRKTPVERPLARLLGLSVAEVTLIAIVIVLAVAAVVVMRFVGEGALIEGVVGARQGGT